MHRDSFSIDGLGDEQTLEGVVTVNGAKNAILKAMAATPLFDSPVTFHRVPNVEDVSRLAEIIHALGPSLRRDDGTLTIDGGAFTGGDIPSGPAKHLRASVVLTGPLLARLGRVSFPHPGGCVIGMRPIDLFIDGFKKMGASVAEHDDAYVLTAQKGRLRGADIFFRVQSVTGTETFMMAAVLADGVTVLKNCAMEPEVTHLAEFLNRCGAHIHGAGTTTITITGGKPLNAMEPYVTMPDRIEAGSFLILAALAGKDVTITGCVPEHLDALVFSLRESGVSVESGGDFLRVVNRRPRAALRPLSLRTHEYPGFPTDLQAPMLVFLTQAEGESFLFETIFEGRLSYTADIIRMGADIRMYDTQRAVVKGRTPLKGKELEAPDLRAGLAYIIAGAIASGRTTVANAYQVDRGYERIESRLRDIGLSIQRCAGDEGHASKE